MLRRVLVRAIHMMPRSPSRTPPPPAKKARLESTVAGSTPTTADATVAKPPSSETLAEEPKSRRLSKMEQRALHAPPKNVPARPAEELLQAVEEEMSLPIQIPRTYAREIDYENKLVLAPMVRSGTMPMRLLSLHYQAGLVWGPEVVDKAIIGSTRVVDPVTGVITYTKFSSEGCKPIFQCHPVEKPFLIFQIGSSDPELAAQAAQVVQQDVAGFDLNCGCPKPFSVHAGMGAALLSTPDILLAILQSLLKSTSLPVSCKIRLLPDQPSTLLLAARILRTGVRCLTVHCRTRDMRSTTKALWDRLRDIVQLGKRRGVPVSCNGDGQGWSNWEAIREATGVSSVMIARAAESNPSIFRPEGPVSTAEDLVPNVFLPMCLYLDNHWSNTKFILASLKPSPQPISMMNKADKIKISQAVTASRSYDDALDIFKLTRQEGLAKGKQFIQDLEAQLRARDPSVYGDEKPIASPSVSSGQTTTQSEAAAAIEGQKEGETDIWTRRRQAEEQGRTVDELPEESILQREAEDDEEQALNETPETATAAATPING